ncbi:hypothetical protein CH25_gp32 [Mycobacterium phage EagleEye]|uniref:Uncharacterized protein n=1 Tax=Mycobacterium phage EagleEye TaxID=1429759 RepID=W0LMT1_9CAUD|nr:hypothetical protein CH25_gp32 [Mycobacterium phage EagleEye]AHG23854.1 hypothetical protein PBI_EAGLEEYE_74 [Mycobacterium phage EagleEye]QDK03507.1 hypothetical protein SEA_LUCYEDI_73 [Mycobacterium phage Lucyedi]QNJ55854.1 hypothetical protein SEA_PAINTERBOY_72 [Mycobacterium phage PainterBoy]
MTLYEQIRAILRRNVADSCPNCEPDVAAEELHALVIELYGPPF